jgi:hypothetical protein
MTRGRESNTAHLYQRTTEHEYGHQEADGTHLVYRGDSRDAANHNQLAITAHEYAAHTPAAAVGPVEQAASG